MMTNQPTHKAKTLDGTWIEGWYDGANIWKEGDDRYPYAIIEYTLCRSTYRPDSNGKMMYEGDEVIVGDILFTIKWCDTSSAFKLSVGDFLIPMSRYTKTTLTGKNKHD
jgi:hypothetical protein